MIDSHCHLNFAPLVDNISALIDACAKMGVAQFIVPSTDVASWQTINTLASQYPSIIHPAFGFHPWFLNPAPAMNTLDALDIWLDNRHAVAIGECGLDFYHGMADSDVQHQVFEYQIHLAQKHNLPLIIHARKSLDTILNLLKQQFKLPTGVLHGFNGSIVQAEKASTLGLYFGIGKQMITGGRAYQQMIQTLPADRLLLESDSPDQMLPNQTHGTPQNITTLATHLATCRNTSYDALVVQCTANTKKLFAL